MASYRLSPQAEQDIEAILQWTHEEFGAKVRRRYETLLTRAIMDVAEDPDRVGTRARPEIGVAGGTIISAIAGTASGGRLGRFIDPAMSSCSLTLFPPLEMVNTAFPVSVPSAAVVMPLSTATWAPVGNGSVSSDRPVKRGNAPDKLGNGSSRQDPALKLTNLVPYRCKDLGAGPGHLA